MVTPGINLNETLEKYVSLPNNMKKSLTKNSAFATANRRMGGFFRVTMQGILKRHPAGGRSTQQRPPIPRPHITLQILVNPFMQVQCFREK